MEITKWEYKDCIDEDRKILVEELNKLGKQGWEAFATYTHPSGYPNHIILKRPCGRLQVIEKVNGKELNTEQNQNNGYER